MKSTFTQSRMNNGVTFVTKRQVGFKGISIGVWFKVGARHELPSRAGISHFIEHLLFKGTPKRDALKIVSDIESVGGEINAMTDKEYTCYHILISKEHLNKAGEILSDIILNTGFKKPDIEIERKVILQEIATVGETPEEYASDLFLERVFGDHGLGRNILGTSKTIRATTPGEIKRYFYRHYHPQNAVVAAVGDVSHIQVKKAFKALSKSKWPNRDSIYRPSPHEVKMTFNSGFWRVKKKTEQSHLMWGLRCGSSSSSDRYSNLILSTYLGGGMSSILFQRVREKLGLAYHIYSYVYLFEDVGLFSVYAALKKGKVKVCIHEIEKAVLRILKKGISSKELKIAKGNLRGSILLTADDLESEMISLGKHQLFYGKPVSVEQICDGIDSVSLREVNQTAEKLFSDHKRSILVLGG